MTRRRGWALALVLAGLLGPGAAAGYEPQVHQRLTFFAAKVLNRCVEGTGVAPLTPLQVRFIANGNMGLAGSNALVRFFRWSYFDVADRDDRQFLWIISTRFLDDFDAIAARLDEGRDAAERFGELGRIASYVQLVSAPSRALPVYTARFWRWSFGDRFDDYPLDAAALEAALEDLDCDFLADAPASYREVLFDVGRDTLDSVRAPIDGLPTTWESFWMPGREPGDFGDYGPAGNNFGRKVEFRCLGDPAERCVLLEGDPLYAEFALARQLSAVRGTARVMLLHQLRNEDLRMQQADR